nr:hypothetical protein [Angustibacter aerolatus]
MPESQVDDAGLLPVPVVAPVLGWLSALARDDSARQAVVRRTLDGWLDTMSTRTDGLVTALGLQRLAHERLRVEAAEAYSRARRDVDRSLSDGSLLRGEILARWQEVVGTGELLRSLQERVGGWRDRISSALRGRPHTQPDLGQALQSGVEQAGARAGRGRRRGRRTTLARDAGGAALLDAHPALERPDAETPERIGRMVRDWQGAVLEPGARRGRRQAGHRPGAVVRRERPRRAAHARGVQPDRRAVGGRGRHRRRHRAARPARARGGVRRPGRAHPRRPGPHRPGAAQRRACSTSTTRATSRCSTRPRRWSTSRPSSARRPTSSGPVGCPREAPPHRRGPRGSATASRRSSAPSTPAATGSTRPPPGARAPSWARSASACGSPASTPSSHSPGPPAAASRACSTRSPGSSSSRPARGVPPRRPRPPACGVPRAPTSLLDWLGVPSRHRLSHESQASDEADDLRGLVLLDLPDHDSTEVAHRLEVDRLVGLVDVLVWVTDPQKYADAAVHRRYLSRLSGHDAVTVVLLNQADRLDDASREACLRDLTRLVRADGLRDAEVLPTSAVRGDGLPHLREPARRRRRTPGGPHRAARGRPAARRRRPAPRRRRARARPGRRCRPAGRHRPGAGAGRRGRGARGGAGRAGRRRARRGGHGGLAGHQAGCAGCDPTRCAGCGSTTAPATTPVRAPGSREALATSVRRSSLPPPGPTQARPPRPRHPPGRDARRRRSAAPLAGGRAGRRHAERRRPRRRPRPGRGGHRPRALAPRRLAGARRRAGCCWRSRPPSGWCGWWRWPSSVRSGCPTCRPRRSASCRCPRCCWSVGCCSASCWACWSVPWPGSRRGAAAPECADGSTTRWPASQEPACSSRSPACCATTARPGRRSRCSLAHRASPFAARPQVDDGTEFSTGVGRRLRPVAASAQAASRPPDP